MFEVEVKGEFSAAHFIKLYDGSYEPRHGHDWKVAVRVQSKALDRIGVVVDFEPLKVSLHKVLGEFNERCFNDHPDFANGKLNPSTENIARLIYDRLKTALPAESKLITKVSVWETPDAQASYLP